MQRITTFLSLGLVSLFVVFLLGFPNQEENLTLSGRVEGEAPEGKVPLAFHFYDKESRDLLYRVVAEANIREGRYTASLPIGGSLRKGGEFYVCATAPEVVMESFQEQGGGVLGIVLLQSSTPGIQQTGHVNISGTLIAGVVQTGAFRMSTGAAAGRVLTSDASGNGTWQPLPPPSGAAGGDLAGTYPNPLVDGLQGRAVASTAPTSGQVLKWDGSAWSPGTDLRDAFWELAPWGHLYYLGGNVGIGTANAHSTLHVTAGHSGSLAATNTVLTLEHSNHAYLSILTPNGNERGILFGQLSNNVAGGIIYNNSATPNGLQFRTNGNNTRMVIDGSGNVGIGTSNPASRLHAETNAGDRAIHGHHTATSGTTYGVWGQSASIAGIGVVGLATAGTGFTYGGQFESASTSGRALLGLASATSGTTYGVYGQSDSIDGRGVLGLANATSGVNYGVIGNSRSTSGTGVYGYASAITGTTYGVFGRSDSPSGRGVYGIASASGGTTYGGWFESRSPDGGGVLAWVTATSGGSRGVWGGTDSAASTAYGVTGQEPAGGAGHAVYAVGTFAATGTKSFQIDHPLSPETHYLNHFCTEGPEPYNAYGGNVVTDAKGYATVRLPDYFESINRDFRYQLTVLDDGEREDFVLVKVVRKIRNNQFTIRTSAPHVEVSWRVEAVRNDRWVQKYGYKTEQEKEDEIKGKYLNPELFGMPKEYGILYRPDVERERMSSPRAPERPREIKAPEAPRRPQTPSKEGARSAKAR